MNRLIAFGRFWYDFVVGDDWRVALTIVAALAATTAVNQMTGTAPWWIIVVAVALVLPVTIRRATRHRG
jgi:hypothetical protein